MEEAQQDSELARLGPVARMMVAVAGHAITAHLQFRALVELLVEQGVIDRDALEAQFSLMRVHELDSLLDEWFPAEIALHLKAVMQTIGPASDTDNGSPSPYLAGLPPTEP